ncbi:MAG TPA: murein L,D-transpeptidase catalytic domain family protein [Kofleriaceae bacterium]|jgi:hypothetical protein
MLMRTSIATLILAITGCAGDAPDLAPPTAPAVDPSQFVLPNLTAAQRAQIVHAYPQLDPTGEVPRGLLEDALVYYDVNKALIPQTTYFVVVDLSQYSGHDRFWLVDVATGAVEHHMVAHGAGSDPSNDGYATLFSNTPGSNMSSLGFFLTGELYDGTHPHSMRIDGLSPTGSPNGMANTNVRDRDVVVHEADYVSDSNTDQQGRSDGCFALDPAIELSMVNRITGGTLMYAATSPLNPPVGTCADTIAAAGGVIDNGDSCFSTGGPATGLRSVTTAGYHDNLVWTHTTDDATEQNFAQWSFDFVSAGRYRVDAYTAAAYAQSKQAAYVIHAGSADTTVTLDQTAVDGWQTLGELDFAQGPDQYVQLGDNTGEPGSEMIQLVFDAVRVTAVGSGG